MLHIKKAERKQRKFRCALIGPSGSGKTMTGLRLATGLKNGGRILVLDTEQSSSTLYADTLDFDYADLNDHSFESFYNAISEAAKAKYDVLVIDSVSHAWEGLLERKEQEAKKSRYNDFTAWAVITPMYNKLIKAITSYPGHVIVTMRAKSDYVIEEKNGRQSPKRIGLAAVMRPGSEYEFDVVGVIDIEHNMVVEKTRFSWLADKVIQSPDEDLGRQIRDWLNTGKKASPAEHRIETKCSLQGKVLSEIPQQELIVCLSDERRDKMTDTDIHNITLFLEGTNE